MLQLTELVTPWSFVSQYTRFHLTVAVHGLPIDPTEIPLTARCGVCSSNASTIARFATSTTWNSVSSRSGVASIRTSLTEQFDSGVFDYARVSVQTGATLSTNCNWCFCVRTAKATFPYWKLLFLSSIFKTAVAQKLCSEFCWNLQLLRRKDGN